MGVTQLRSLRQRLQTRPAPRAGSPTHPPRMGSALKGPFHLSQVPDGLLDGQ